LDVPGESRSASEGNFQINIEREKSNADLPMGKFFLSSNIFKLSFLLPENPFAPRG
jgi:hypothetical protein